MGQQLGDGSIVPSFLGVEHGPGPTATETSLNDTRLHVGRVVAVYAPVAKGNSNGKFFEYDVEVDIGTTSKVYPRAIMADAFGGMADFLSWTPRISQGGQNQVNKGTRVILLCLNGHSGRSLIIGGAKHPGRKLEDDNQEQADDGHNLKFEFNGVSMSINKDGDLTILHKGATGADGKVTSDSNDTNGTKIVLNKDGDVFIGAGKDGENASIKWESKNKHVVVKADATLIGDATDHMMLGDTFRKAQKQMHSDLKSALQSLSQDIMQASIGMTTGSKAMSVPISGPVAAGPMFSQAAMQLQTASQDISKLSSAIDTFEQGGPYVSDSNKND